MWRGKGCFDGKGWNYRYNRGAGRKSLSEGDCIIETDNQMIDCGFRTQLDNMVRTLRMLV
ncbi:MAG: hypothetical protein ACLSD6_00425 [Clostridium sp.]